MLFIVLRNKHHRVTLSGNVYY